MGNLRRGDGDLGTEGDLLEYGDLRLDIEGAILGECLRGETERLGEAERRNDLCLEGDGERLLGEIDRCLPRGDKDVLLGLRCSLKIKENKTAYKQWLQSRQRKLTYCRNT